MPFAPMQAGRDETRAVTAADQPDDLLYATFLGGSDYDVGYGIAVDDAGSAYVTGLTRSANFPANGVSASS